MKSVRIQNDLQFSWSFFTKTDTEKMPYNLEGKDLTVVISNQYDDKVVVKASASGNTAYFSFLGKDQKETGIYTLTMFMDYQKEGMVAIDRISHFRLVDRQNSVMLESCRGGCSPAEELLSITSEIDMYTSNDYNLINNKPKINGVELVGDKPLSEFEIASVSDLSDEVTRAKAAERSLSDRLNKVEHPYISLERLRKYLYRVTFDKLTEDNGSDEPVINGCSSYVKDGKLHTNLDWDYDNTASFVVRTCDFEGQSFIKGLEEGNLSDALIAQLPYRIHRGVNNCGISLASHILFNDWEWTGCGNKSINLTRLPFLVLSKVKSMATIAQDLAGVLNNLYCPEGLAALGYLLQLIVTDGTTTYAIMPPTNEGGVYVLQDISEYPKLTNFRWVSRGSVSRGDENLQTRPTGIERWNAMPCDLKDLRFTKAYESVDRLSEFIGLRGTTKASTDEQLIEIYNDARGEYLQRQRDGKTWHTMESAIYGKKLESLWIQEDFEDECIVQFDEATDADIDSLFSNFNTNRFINLFN